MTLRTDAVGSKNINEPGVVILVGWTENSQVRGLTWRVWTGQNSMSKTQIFVYLVKAGSKATEQELPAEPWSPKVQGRSVSNRREQ